MRKFNVVEVSFDMVTATTLAPRVVAKGLDADKALAKMRSLNDGTGEGSIARAYKVVAEVATA